MRTALLFLLISYSSSMFAQKVVATAGSTLGNTHGSISYTIGESVAHTLAKGDKTLTQGFHQSIISISMINELKDLGFSISIYPNPTSDILKIKIGKENLSGMHYLLFDLGGRLMSQKNLESSETSVPVQYLRSGIYLLKVQDGSKELKTFKIIKQSK